MFTATDECNKHSKMLPSLSEHWVPILVSLRGRVGAVELEGVPEGFAGNKVLGIYLR